MRRRALFAGQPRGFLGADAFALFLLGNACGNQVFQVGGFFVFA